MPGNSFISMPCNQNLYFGKYHIMGIQFPRGEILLSGIIVKTLKKLQKYEGSL